MVKRRAPMHVVRVAAGAWMVRSAISVLPPGRVRETLRVSCVVWLELMEHEADLAEAVRIEAAASDLRAA